MSTPPCPRPCHRHRNEPHVTETATTTVTTMNLRRRRGVKPLRATTRALRSFANHAEHLALLAGLAIVMKVEFHVGPSWLEHTGTQGVLVVLALAGVADLTRRTAFLAANQIDPDIEDGDAFWAVSHLLKELGIDVRGGALPYEVMSNLQTSHTLPRLYALLDDLAAAFADDDEDDDADAMREAAASIRSASRTLGDHHA
ncbi:hypothetical protein RVR_P166 (plasmid) [Actinacidiphila reveromycinica]|uniref:Uncharacterized protein n=1 Tax=Actinacidiphila reveromycinica TaxID=659352 RepID=A0A7R6QDV8_9ACTN|nr:hypothetical protein RVR_P166 [Streptomyces sp. SN-593]